MKFEMSTKASPPTTTTMVKIKKEIPNDEIKDFAETAMNELLGWYGYDSVDRIDLSSKTSRLVSASNSNIDSLNRIDINGSRINHRDDSTISDRESSREDSKSPSSTKAGDKQETNCGWCRRVVPENSPEFLTTPDGPRYCSESCFAQSRRASFKRAKTCDWCRHVRHAVSYVDFQDGASQLQFCSDKCLNQYKMQIFCKETQAHLDMNPHLKEKSTDNSGALITPELWLKNCRSRSASPVSELSRSSTPTQPPSVTQQRAHKPIISVAPVSKLMSKNTNSSNSNTSTTTTNRQSPKHARKKRNPRPSTTSNTNLGISTCSNSKTKLLASTLASSPALPKSCSFTNVQDMRMNVPQISPIDGAHTPRSAIPPSFFSHSPNAFPIRPPFLPSHPHPRLIGLPPPQQFPPIIPPDLSTISPLIGATPPVTVMVPYPIIVPLPIPIPIPLPIIDFIKAAGLKDSKPQCEAETNKSTNEKHMKQDPIDEQRDDVTMDEPLDFTKSKTIETDSNVENRPKTSLSMELEDEEEISETQKIPKFKITRLHAKRVIAKESENSRPLRKRRRVIDCDYLRVPLKEDDDSNAKNKK